MENGTIISRPMLGIPFFNHYGIVVNAENGTIADFGSRGKRVISICEFMANETTMQIYESNMMDCSPDEILNRFELVKSGRFTIWWNNCADFMKHFGRPDLYHKELGKVLALMAFIIVILVIWSR
jgi:hypothetical protein